MIPQEPTEEGVRSVLKQFRLPTARAAEPLVRDGVAAVVTALAHFAALLPPAERPSDPLELLEFSAATNAFAPLCHERGLPVTLIFYAAIHPAYFEGDDRV